MAYIEHLGGLKYRLCTNDPSSIKRNRLYDPIELPADIAKSERKTKLYLDLELAKFVERVENGEHIKPEKMTLRQFVPKWKKGYADQNMGEYTRKMAVYNLEAYLFPEFGDARLDQIKPIHLVTLFADLKRKNGKPLATNSMLNIYKAAKSVFDAAHDWKVISHNPMDGVKRPSAAKKEKKEMRKRKKAYTRSESESVIFALYGLSDLWRLYFTGVILGGFRRGEMLAIEWTEVDQANRGLHITKQITFDEEGKAIEGELKTEESEAFIPMPTWYMDELKAYRRDWIKEKLNCKEWLGGNKQYVFHSGSGKHYYPNTPSLTWRKFLVRNNLPHIPLHGLRHTTAMILRESGADMKAIQERLRHSKHGYTHDKVSEVTADTYVHESDLISRESADRLESLNPKNLKSAPRFAPGSTE